MAPVFLGAEDHPPRDRRPKCLTGSAITLVRSARPNPRGRHARVADPSGVECQRDGSDLGQRMEAGDGALTQDRCPAPSQDAHLSPALRPRGSPAIGVVQTGTEKRKAAADEYWRAHSRSLETPGWYQVEAPNPSAPPSSRPDWRSRKGSLPEWGETAGQAPVGTTRARSRPCRDVPSLSFGV